VTLHGVFRLFHRPPFELTTYVFCLVHVGTASFRRTHSNSTGRTSTRSSATTGECSRLSILSLRGSLRTVHRPSLQETKRGTFDTTVRNLHIVLDDLNDLSPQANPFVQQTKTPATAPTPNLCHNSPLAFLVTPFLSHRANWLSSFLPACLAISCLFPVINANNAHPVRTCLRDTISGRTSSTMKPVFHDVEQ